MHEVGSVVINGCPFDIKMDGKYTGPIGGSIMDTEFIPRFIVSEAQPVMKQKGLLIVTEPK